MVRVSNPLYTQEAHGWFGNYTYHHRGVVPNPYPLGFGQHIHVPYSLWARNIFGLYHVQAFGVRPYPGFIGAYYNKLGWCYQRRRTWHGIIYSAISPPISAQPLTDLQNAYKTRFGDASLVWHQMSQNVQDVYNQVAKGQRFTGFNWWVKLYVKNTPITISAVDAILQENSGYLFTENNFTLVQEPPNYFLLETGGKILTEANESVILD